MIHENREKWREERETGKDREDIFKCNNITKKVREMERGKEREGKRVSETKSDSPEII